MVKAWLLEQVIRGFSTGQLNRKGLKSEGTVIVLKAIGFVIEHLTHE